MMSRLTALAFLILSPSLSGCSGLRQARAQSAEQEEILSRFSSVITKRCIQGVHLSRTVFSNLNVPLVFNDFGPSDGHQVRTTPTFVRNSKGELEIFNVMFDNVIQKAINKHEYAGTGLEPDGEGYRTFTATGWLVPVEVHQCLTTSPYDALPIILIDHIFKTKDERRG